MLRFPMFMFTYVALFNRCRRYITYTAYGESSALGTFYCHSMSLIELDVTTGMKLVAHEVRGHPEC